MERWLVALVAGLLGGAAGALAVDFLHGSRDSGAAVEASGSALPRDFDERLVRALEVALSRPRSVPGVLQGRSDEVDPAATGGADGAGAGPASAALLASVERSVESAVERKWKEMAASGSPPPKPEGPPASTKRRASLAEVAGEIGLSRGEEDQLRKIYEDTTNRYLKLLADPDGDVEQVRKDLEAAKTEKGRAAVMMKYVPKLLPKIGEFASIGMEQDAKIAEAIGEEKAGQLDDRFEVTEGDPFGFSANVRMGRGR